MEQKSNGTAVASLVLGIISVVCIFLWLTIWGTYIGLAAGIVGLVLGVKARKEGTSGLATAGFVLAIIGLVLNAILFFSCAIPLGCAACAGQSLITELNSLM